MIELASDSRWLPVDEEQTGTLLPPVEITFEVKIVGNIEIFGNLVKPFNLRELEDYDDNLSASSGCFHDDASLAEFEKELNHDEPLDGLLEYLQERASMRKIDK